jgi:6-hydroxy-3-succinoylpyridine 3-monooxygenase
MTTPQNTSRTIVYIDGFNLYYGVLAQSSYRWLDLDLLAHRLRPAEIIHKVKYFTAMVSGPTRTNQEAYLKALSTKPRVEIVMGNFKKKTVECSNGSCPGQSRKRRFFKTLEEKRTDVNIALHMLDDLYRGACNRMVLISGDSDLVPAIELVTARVSSVKVNVYIPVPAHSQTGDRERSYKKELRTVSTTVRELPAQLLQHCLFPNPVLLPDGSELRMPAGWGAPKGPKPFSAAPVSVGQCSWCGKT